MPPCHGGDRRFESGQARHINKTPLYGSYYLITDKNDRYPLTRIARN